MKYRLLPLLTIEAPKEINVGEYHDGKITYKKTSSEDFFRKEYKERKMMPLVIKNTRKLLMLG